MIIAKLKGGLGNQMFQYACGRALSLRAKSKGKENPLKLDISGFEKTKGSDTPRAYDLAAFNVQADIATDEEIRAAKYPFGIASKAWRFFRTKVLRKFYVAYDPKLAAKTGSLYLEGYFQTEKYFSDFEDEIRQDFMLKKPLGKAAQELFDKISRDPYAVSLHVRRGDYVTDKKWNKEHGTCDMEYYEKAVALIAGRIGKPSIYVFSDDIGWAKENMAFSCPVAFVSSKDIRAQEEIILMSACRNNIIANSTFSWWGAWLNRNPEKIVVAPLRWSNVHNDDWYKDIIPEPWTRI